MTTGPGQAQGRIYQLNIARGGVPKLPMAEAEVTTAGIAGDYQRDTRSHGGPDRALCLYTLEQIRRLQAEGHPIFPGSVGENVTLEGVPQEALAPGTRLRLGAEVVIELTAFATPCKTIAASFADGDFTRIADKSHPGESRAYARVVTAGRIRAGEPVVLVPVGEAERRHDNPPGKRTGRPRRPRAAPQGSEIRGRTGGAIRALTVDSANRRQAPGGASVIH